ncbi:unnamed protein product [Rotaria sp. Silwood1]|nr:unnamed protein product [Rotaria sp. Silwood1]CAF1061321.1 unnamed protein product [Rotaria sp. Silwood1]CAF3352917.1 unnamed protein product [Rotaria sp. Silwood1]CAF3392997.1 unnamed protein product [Rotaria sp. Silwood1]CAF3393251.1 unnamed protein product [Rotaria sp. Silwood1]
MATLHSPRAKDTYKNRGTRRSVISDGRRVSTVKSSGRSISRINVSDEIHESVVFIWFDPHQLLNIHLIGPLRVINAGVQTFTEPLTCFDTIRSSKEKIFFISSSCNNELIATVHDFNAVEGIFIFDPNGENIKGDFPKLFGIFNQQEELLRILKEVLNTFEEIQLEEFAFEQDDVFLWSQLWKEDLISRKVSSNKQNLIEIARQYYRDNIRIMEIIEEFEKSYRSVDVINWCFRSPFPARLLLHALRSHNKGQLSICRFLFADASRFFQQRPKHKSSDQVYRGMKLSSEILDKFEAHVGQLICTSGFFPCTKSRTNALTLASLPTYRPDLLSVLFKIDCDASALFTVLSNKQSTSLIVFDICMTFRIVYVNRGQMSIVKLKTAGEAGKKIALEYLEKHPNETIPTLIDEILKPSEPPPPPPPPTRIPTPPPKPKSALVHIKDSIDSAMTAEEIKAQKYAEQGDIDMALITYQRIQPATVRVLNAMGQLSANRKGDYEYALQCHQQALKLQEMSGEDVSDTLTYLGNVYQSHSEVDLALDYHTRALELHQANPTTKSIAIASNLIGIANARWVRREYSDAIANAEQALALQEALVPPNETSMATTLTLLSNIYQDSGDSTRALDLCTKALPLFERTVPNDSPILAEFLYKLGTLQSNSEALVDAQRSLERSYKIYRKLLPRGHHDRMSTENELRRVMQLRQKNKQKSQTNS